MLKKILFLGFTVTILIFSNNLFAEINSDSEILLKNKTKIDIKTVNFFMFFTK